MSRGAQRFRQSDVTKAIKAAVKAGLSVTRLEIGTDGRIIVFAGQEEQSSSTVELDRELAEFEAQHEG